MRTGFRAAAIAWSAGAALALPAAAGDVDMTDVVEFLHQEGVIDASQYPEIRERAQRRETTRSWSDRLSFSGDFRGRMESFFYAHDARGVNRRDRHRGRYRLRLTGTAEVNDHIDVIFRLASGQNDSRTANTSFGASPDWAPDSIFIDRAYLALTPFPGGTLDNEDTYLGATLGRVPNPFVWKETYDKLLFDHDISLTGGSVLAEHRVGPIGLFANTGYYVSDENSSERDPTLFGLQLGGIAEVADDLEAGGRISVYHFHDLSTEFFDIGVDSDLLGSPATSSGGNLRDAGEDGLSDGLGVDVLGGTSFLRCRCFEDWPLTLFGSVASNLSAQSLPGSQGRQDLAWSIGLQAGDRQALAELGVAYAYLEANAFPSQFIDSDWLDGRTNREGFAFWGRRQVLPNTVLGVDVFYGWELEKGLLFSESIADARRVRVRGDVEVKF